LVIVALIFTLFVNFLMFIPVSYQVKEQVRRLRKVEEIEREKVIENDDNFTEYNTDGGRKLTAKNTEKRQFGSLRVSSA
jgi:uncharacterized membrane protein YgaE (UPF0421/DUF939 family)